MKNLFLYFMLFCMSAYPNQKQKKIKKSVQEGPSFVTYEFSGGRFGDNLLAYLHGKWISYKYELPLLYQPFPYSEALILHREETATNIPSIPHKKKYWAFNHHEIQKNSSLLYTIPYFPDFPIEQNLIYDHHGKKYPYFTIDWQDEQFREIIKRLIQPEEPLPLIELPKAITTVALHIRTGGSFESAQILSQWPSKAPADQFYIKGIQILYEIFNFQPLYIYVFTDANDPKILADRLSKEFPYSNITFGYRDQGNSHQTNVLEDFFSFWQFDCLIRPDSNYSYIPSKLHNYKVVISPESVTKIGKGYMIKTLKIEMFDGTVLHSSL